MNGSNGNGSRMEAGSGLVLNKGNGQLTASAIHPAWAAFIRLCQQIEFGELERVKLQNGLPVSVEVVKRKIKVV
jgi:hypothetical protein